MTIEEIKTLLAGPDYEVLRTHENLGDNIMLLTLGGSYAYGTNVEGSDIDVRGIALPTRRDIYGFGGFEQYRNDELDMTIYEFRKIVSLLCACNPNTIEMLGCRPEQYLILSPAGKMLLENKELFLSKEAVHSFGGYANAQLRRLQVKIARDRVTPDEKSRFILNSINTSLHHIATQAGVPEHFLDPNISDSVRGEDGTMKLLLRPGNAFAGVFAEHPEGITLGQFQSYLSGVKSIEKSYESLGKRNKHAIEKSNAQINKHAMHLVRLYLMAFDILEKGVINTYREEDREFLLQIRDGRYMLEDGTYSPEFFRIIDEYSKRLEYDAKNTSLPETVDRRKVEDLSMTILEQFVLGKLQPVDPEEIKVGARYYLGARPVLVIAPPLLETFGAVKCRYLNDYTEGSRFFVDADMLSIRPYFSQKMRYGHPAP